jgi:hypothetical protein
MAKLELNPIPGGDAAPVEQAKPDVLAIVKAKIESGAPVDQLTAIYLKIRNSAADLKQQYSKKVAPLNGAIEALETHFLAKMLEMGVDSLKNANGTPYKTTKTSITVADTPAFLTFVLDRALANLTISAAAKEAVRNSMIESGQLALIEARASKLAVEAVIEEIEDLPPGLNRRVETAVNVRSD